MWRRGGNGGPTVEQMRSIEIDVFRRAGYVGTPAANWWVYRNRLFCAGIQPKHWNDNAVTLDNQILRITYLPWHFGGQRAYFLCDCGRRVGKRIVPLATRGAAGSATDSRMPQNSRLPGHA